MGCGHSKRPRGENASAAVELCRGRSALLAEAIAHRYALTDAHRAYAGSLSATGAALHDFLRAVQDAAPPPPGPGSGAGDAPRLAASRNEAEADAVSHAAMAPPPAPASPDASEEEDDDNDVDDGGHDDDDEASDDGGGRTISPSDDEAEPPVPTPEPLQPVAPSPRPTQPSPEPVQMVPPYDPGYPPPYSYGPAYGYGSYAYGGGYGADMAGYGQSFYNYNISYAQSQPPPPYVEQRPQVAAAADHYHYQGEASVPSSQYGGYYSYPYSYLQGGGLPPVPASSDQLLAAPLPTTPSPPWVPTWGFLDPFEAIESYHPAPAAAPEAHERSWTSDDVREDEDIPELEDEESGLVVHARDECTSGSTLSDEGHLDFILDDVSCNGSSTVHGVEDSVVEEQPDDSGVAEPPAVPEKTGKTGVAEAEPPAVPEKTYSSDVEVVQEIKLQFDNASKSAGDVCKMLEVGKKPYYEKKSSIFKVPSMVFCGKPSKGKAIMQFEEEKAMESGNLSSSLQKLYIWEKKLLKEVKAVEKIRVLYNQKHKEQKKLYYNGAEACKLEPIEVRVKQLSMKMNIGIQIINDISDKINKLRDEELWPQTQEMIKGFIEMLHTMEECHQMQCHAFSHAQSIDSTIAATRFHEHHMDLIKQLEHHLLDMIANFVGWFNAQKSYTTILNEWLKRGIEYVPEVIDDGSPPFSPGHLGAPRIFTICNNWAISLGRISEAEVVSTMQALASKVMSLWDKHMSEWKKIVLDNSEDLDRDLRSLDKDDLLMRRAVEVKNKKLLVLAPNQRATEAPPSEGGLQSCMVKVFEAMESFTSACENAYKDLGLLAEEEKAGLEDQENGRPPAADISGTGQLD